MHVSFLLSVPLFHPFLFHAALAALLSSFASRVTAAAKRIRASQYVSSSCTRSKPTLLPPTFSKVTCVSRNSLTLRCPRSPRNPSYRLTRFANFTRKLGARVSLVAAHSTCFLEFYGTVMGSLRVFPSSFQLTLVLSAFFEKCVEMMSYDTEVKGFLRWTLIWSRL